MLPERQYVAVAGYWKVAANIKLHCANVYGVISINNGLVSLYNDWLN